MPRRSFAADFNHCGAVELSVRFALWASALKKVPSAKRIVARFGCSRATAYRWRAAFCAATGQPSRAPTSRLPTPAQQRRLARERVEGELRHAQPVPAQAACDSDSDRDPQARIELSPTPRSGTPS